MRKILFLQLICLSFIFTGCFPDGTTENVEKNHTIVQENDISEGYETIENIKVNVKFTDTAKDSYAEASDISLKKWNEDLLNMFFVKNKVIKEKNEFDSDHNKGEKVKSITFQDGSNIVYENGYLYYNSFESKKNNYGFYLFFEDIYKSNRLINEFFSDEEIDGLDKQTAIDEVKEFIKLSNIEVMDEPLVYTLESESINKLINTEKIMDKNGELIEEFTKDQDAYAIIFNCKIDDVPILPFAYYSSNKALGGYGTDGSYIRCIVNKNGIVYVTAKCIPEKFNLLEEKDICTSQKAVETVFEKYRNLKPKNEIEIVDAKLIYIHVPDKKEYVLKSFQPVWAVIVEEKVFNEEKNAEDIYAEAIMIDAYNGMEY